ncbi:MAG TPA: hypothetical protein VG537_03415, partial [Candidatus Kapabacteria bacterium]|nr:hypothetical protein [Candidatus Kapabacteria bacterium]
LASSSGYSTYKWSTGETTSSIAVTKTGDYTVAVTNSAGCSGTSAVTHIRVLPDSVPKPVIAAATTTICAGDSIPIGLTESYASYRWSTDQTTPAIYVSKAGSYSVTVTNAAGCSGTSAPVTFIIAQKPAVQLTASGPTTFCEGDSVTLRATNGYQYTWWNGATKLSNTTASIVVTTSGTYAVTATNAAGCDSTTAPIGVTVNPAPHPAIVGPSSICIGGTASYSIAQAVGQMLWQLTPASLGTITSGQGTNTIAVQWGSSTATGILEIVVTGSDGCSGTATMPITIDSHLTPTIAASGPLAFCPGSSVTLDAGAGYASYQWSKDGTNILDATNETLTTSQSGSYTVFVTNTTGCNGASESEQVTVYPAPVQPVITRSGAQLTSTPASSYAWTFNGAPLADATQTITANQGGTYTVTTTDANGCTATSGPFEFTNTGEATVMLTSGNTGNPGDKIAVPMTLVSSTDLAQSGASDYVARIRFNASMLAPQSVASLGTVSGSDRIITVTGTLPQAGGVPESSGLLQNIDFIATLGSDTCTDLTIDTFYFTNANVAVTREDGGFCLTGICMQDGHARLVNPDARVSLAAPRPNPASQSVEIDYELAEPGPTKLYIEDMLGRTAMVIRDEPMLPGAYHESVPLAALASGTYRYILVTPSQVLSQPMEVIK